MQNGGSRHAGNGVARIFGASLAGAGRAKANAARLPGNIAQLLPNRVTFAAFARVRSFCQESRKSNAVSDYRRLLIGIQKIAFGVRIPVVWLRGQCPRVDSFPLIGNDGCDGHNPR